MAIEVVASLALAFVDASIACTSASMPVAAVSGAGNPVVSTGSSTISPGLSSSPHSHTLAPSAAASTAVRVASDPVPEVVGTHTDTSRVSGNGLAQSP